MNHLNGRRRVLLRNSLNVLALVCGADDENPRKKFRVFRLETPRALFTSWLITWKKLTGKVIKFEILLHVYNARTVPRLGPDGFSRISRQELGLANSLVVSRVSLRRPYVWS
jgi:hypothetical protein